MTLRLNGSTSGYVEIDAPAVAGTSVLTLPTGTGTIATTTDQGLVHINTTTFSAVSSVSLNNCFTSAYDNYAILFSNCTITTSGYLLFRLRVGGVDNSTSNYRFSQVNGSSAGVASAGGSAGDTSARICFWNGGGYNSVNNFQINSPAITSHTSYSTTSMETGATVFASTTSGAFNATTQFDGLTIFPASGTMSGTVRVYGYKNGTP